MTTKQIIKQMEKEFDEAVYAEAKKRCFKSQTAVIFWDGFGGYDVEEKWKKEVMSDSNFVKSFISSYTRTLLESFGEEIIGKNIRHVTASKGEKDHTGDVDTDEVINALQDDIDAVNDYKNEQRLKMKEIISSIGK